MSKPVELYACLYAKEFPAQALLRLRSGLRDKPCVVTKGAPPLEQVSSLMRKARSIGLARGMTRVELETFPAVYDRGRIVVTQMSMFLVARAPQLPIGRSCEFPLFPKGLKWSRFT
jgi:hypothetical protein